MIDWRTAGSLFSAALFIVDDAAADVGGAERGLMASDAYDATRLEL